MATDGYINEEGERGREREGGTRETNLLSSSLASRPIASISSLDRLGLIALTSSGPNWMSTGPTSLSRGITMGPLLFLLSSRGRVGTGAWIVRVSCSADESEVCSCGEAGDSVTSVVGVAITGGCVDIRAFFVRCVVWRGDGGG